MESSLPNEFDLIVIGTGLIESAISAAASRVGKTVLHIDNKDYYGGIWASINLETLQNHENIFKSRNDFGNDYYNIKDFTINWHVPDDEIISDETVEVPVKSLDSNVDVAIGPNNIEKSELEKLQVELKEITFEGKTDGEIKAEATISNDIIWTKQKLLRDSRKFNLDLTPKIHYARGDFVELLISSNIARYTEFRSVSRILTQINGNLETVPCSRADIFSHSKVNVIEKRMLMKLLTACLNDDNDESLKDYKDKSFKEYLHEQKLSDNLIHYILYCIAMCTNETPCLDGVASTKRFLQSLGRFGKTPFLFSMYGSGEIPQAFCRMSAVFGGVYALNQPLRSIEVDENRKVTGIVCETQSISTNNIVIGMEYLSKDFQEKEKLYISRAIFILDRSIIKSDSEHLTLITIPSSDGNQLCFVVEAGTLTGCCPKNTYVAYVFIKQVKNPQEDLQEFVNLLFNTDYLNHKDEKKPNVLWSCYYSSPDTNEISFDNLPNNLYICPGPDTDLDYDESLKKAKNLFNAIYPNEEFLPRAPDPEDIIIGDDNEIQPEDNVIEHVNEET